MPHSDVRTEISKDIISGIAITIVIIIISVGVPIFSFLSMAIPLPILYYRAKLGRTYATLIAVTAFLGMLFMFNGFSTDILIFVGLIFLGFILAEILELNLSIEKTVIYASGCIMVLAIIEMLFYKSITGIDLYTEISTGIATNIQKTTELTIKLYKEYGITEDKLAVLEKYSKHLEYYMIRLIPAQFMSSILFMSWITILIARPLLKSKHIFCPDFGPLKYWQAPEWMIWGMIASAALVLLPLSSKMWVVIGLYGLILQAMIFFFQGIAILSFTIEKRQFPNHYRVIAYALIILVIPKLAFLAISGLGFIDMWKNFRKLNLIDSNKDANI